MRILIDGYNVIAPVAPPGRGDPTNWLRAERMLLIDRLAEQLPPDLAAETVVVFDAKTRRRQSGDRRVRGILVRFAVDHREADDLIEELIAAHPTPKRLTVVSSDHRLQRAARRAGAAAFDSEKWLDALLEGRIRERKRTGRTSERTADCDREPTAGEKKDAASLAQWMQEFGLSPSELPEIEKQLDRETDPQVKAPGKLPPGFNPFPEGYGEDLLS